MSVRAFKTADELQDMIIEQARILHGPWPSGMTMFVFDDAYGWSASISRPTSEADNFYRVQAGSRTWVPARRNNACVPWRRRTSLRPALAC